MDTVKTAKLKQLQNRKMDTVKSVTDMCEGVVLQKTKGHILNLCTYIAHSNVQRCKRVIEA